MRHRARSIEILSFSVKHRPHLQRQTSATPIVSGNCILLTHTGVYLPFPASGILAAQGKESILQLAETERFVRSGAVRGEDVHLLRTEHPFSPYVNKRNRILAIDKHLAHH
jgi:hypothetical protein